jgi:NifU-like protein
MDASLTAIDILLRRWINCSWLITAHCYGSRLGKPSLVFDKVVTARIAFIAKTPLLKHLRTKILVPSSQIVNEHFLNPKNVGNIAYPDAVGRAGSVTCGAALRVTLSVDESQRITDAKFKSAGCTYLVAATSLLTDQIKGKTTAEAALLGQVPKKSISEGFLSWPDDRDHCAALACEAIVSAVKQYSNSVRDEWNGDEPLICTCFAVTEATIENEIRTGGLRTIADVTRACNAGGGCRSCYSLIEDILGSMNSEWDGPDTNRR